MSWLPPRYRASRLGTQPAISGKLSSSPPSPACSALRTLSDVMLHQAAGNERAGPGSGPGLIAKLLLMSSTRRPVSWERLAGRVLPSLL